MKAGLLILKLSVAIVLTCFGLYAMLFCFGPGGLEPVDIESVVAFFITVIAISLAWLLYRKALKIKPAFFWILLVLYLLSFTLPALVGCYYFYSFLTMG